MSIPTLSTAPYEDLVIALRPSLPTTTSAAAATPTATTPTVPIPVTVPTTVMPKLPQRRRRTAQPTGRRPPLPPSRLPPPHNPARTIPHPDHDKHHHRRTNQRKPHRHREISSDKPDKREKERRDNTLHESPRIEPLALLYQPPPTSACPQNLSPPHHRRTTPSCRTRPRLAAVAPVPPPRPATVYMARRWDRRSHRVPVCRR